MAEVVDRAAVGRHPRLRCSEGSGPEEVADRLAVLLDGPGAGRGRPDAACGCLRRGGHLAVGRVRGADRVLRGGGVVVGEGPLRRVPVGDLLVGDVVRGDFRVHGDPVRAVVVLPRPARQLAGVRPDRVVGEVAGLFPEDLADRFLHGAQGRPFEVLLPCPVEELSSQDAEMNRRCAAG